MPFWPKISLFVSAGVPDDPNRVQASLITPILLIGETRPLEFIGPLCVSGEERELQILGVKVFEIQLVGCLVMQQGVSFAIPVLYRHLLYFILVRHRHHFEVRPLAWVGSTAKSRISVCS